MSALNEPAIAEGPAPKAVARGLFLTLVAIGALGGALLGALLGGSTAAMLADGLDLGQVRDRTSFVVTAALIGTPTGLAAALWPILRARRPRRTGLHASLAVAAWAGLCGFAFHAFAFSATTPPPPMTPLLLVEVRVSSGTGAPLGEDGTALSIHSRAEGRDVAGMKLSKDADGRDVVRGSFPISSLMPVDWVRLQRRGKPEIRFSLNLPSDPPSTADFTQWLAADRAVPGAEDGRGETVEMRFRIDRRVLR